MQAREQTRTHQRVGSQKIRQRAGVSSSQSVKGGPRL